MSQKQRNLFCPVSKHKFIQQLQENECDEIDLVDRRHDGIGGSAIGNRFIYLKIIAANRNDRIGNRSFISFTVWQLNLDDDQEKPDRIGMLLAETKSYGVAARRVNSDDKIAVLGFRFPLSSEDLAEYPSALVLDDECPNGIIYVVSSDDKSNDSASSTCGKAVKSAGAGASTSPSKSGYAKLADVVSCSSDRIDVFGVVQWFNYEEKNGKKYLRLAISDPTISGNQILCNLCADTTGGKSPLPDVRQIGDIVRFRRIAIQKQNDEVSLFGRMGTYGLSAVVWDGESGTNMTSRMATTTNFTVEENDFEMIRYLRQWLHEQNPSTMAKTGDPSDLVTISRFPRGRYRSIFVRVLGLWDYGADCAIIRVTDGTRSGYSLYRLLSAADPKAVRIFFDSSLSNVPEDCTVDIFVYDHYKKQAMTLKANDFVLIKNIHLALVKGQKDMLCFTVHGGGEQFNRGLYSHEPTSALAMDLERHLTQFAASRPSVA